MQQILRAFMRFIGAVMAGLTTGICVLLASMLFRAAPALAAPVPPPLPTVPVVTVTPLIAVPNVPRKIIISSAWLNNCGPANVKLESTDTPQTGILTVRVSYAAFDPNTFVCQPILGGDSRLELDYTPKAEGVLRVVVVTDTETKYGEGNVVTSGVGKTRSVVDISGLWFDPATSGSGITFQHNFRSDDVSFGTWYLYDQAGGARWYTMQNAVWNADGRRFEAQLLESRSPFSLCSVTVPCPVASTASVAVGKVNISLVGDEFSRTAPLLMKVEALSLSGATLFSSNVSRLTF
jgi:hypothetical protein